jgi:hypothetical protein
MPKEPPTWKKTVVQTRFYFQVGVKTNLVIPICVGHIKTRENSTTVPDTVAQKSSNAQKLGNRSIK